MPKPHNKTTLISESHKEREALEDYLTTLTCEEKIVPGVVGDWSVKDMLAHLYEWEQMVLRWLAAGEAGETPHVPAEGYKWNQIPVLNESIRQKYHGLPLDEVEKILHPVFLKIHCHLDHQPQVGCYQLVGGFRISILVKTDGQLLGLFPAQQFMLADLL